MENISLNFNADSLIAINALIALMMFGVSLELTKADFKRVATNPKAPMIGLMLQFLFLPAVTCFATWLLDIPPSLAIGMMLVASCPGGAFSNIMTWLAKGNVTLSVSMTAISSIAATLLTPLNFTFYVWLNPNTRSLLTEITMDTWGLLQLVIMVLAVPVVLGMIVGNKFPIFTSKVQKPLKIFALMFLLLLTAVAFASNTEVFLKYFQTFVFLVIGHNALALSLGYFGAKLMGLAESERRAISLEVGIQNGALALVIIFTFFPGESGMLLIAAFWGIWHLISGLILSTIWSKNEPLQLGTTND